MKLKLLLADDHQIVRQGLKAILDKVPDFHLAGDASTGMEAIRQVERHQPDVLVLDLMLPEFNGLEVTRHLAHRHPRTRVVILSMHDNAAYVVEALRAGATAYVLKESGIEELVEAIRKAAAGVRYLSRSISEHDLGNYLQIAEPTAKDSYESLTPRERQVVQLTVEGHSAAEIARRLFISRRTVETHRANIMRKLGVRNQRELTRYVVKRDVLLHSEETLTSHAQRVTQPN